MDKNVTNNGAGQMFKTNAAENHEGATEGEKKPTRKTLITDIIKKMRRKMRTTNVLYHAVRNNPRHRDKYYLALIAEVGFDNWQYVPTALRMAWESGRNNFDTLYGLIKSFYKNEQVITAFVEAEDNKTEKQVNDILKSLQTNGTAFSTTQMLAITETLIAVLEKAKKMSQQEQNEYRYIENIVSVVNQIQKP